MGGRIIAQYESSGNTAAWVYHSQETGMAFGNTAGMELQQALNHSRHGIPEGMESQ